MNSKGLARYIGLVVALVLLFALPSILSSDYWIHVCILTTITALMAVSLRALARTGQVSMGSAGFMLAGAYCSAILAIETGMSVWLTIPLGGSSPPPLPCWCRFPSSGPRVCTSLS